MKSISFLKSGTRGTYAGNLSSYLVRVDVVVDVVEVEGNYTVVRTPEKSEVIVPSSEVSVLEQSAIDAIEERVVRKHGRHYGFCEPSPDIETLAKFQVYDSLNDGARHCSALAAGDTEVYYLIDDHSYARDIRFKPEQYVTKDGLAETHKLLGKVRGTDLEELFQALQGEFWSPVGQANAFIRSSGLQHTSLSVGDAIKLADGRVFVCAGVGFTEITE